MESTKSLENALINNDTSIEIKSNLNNSISLNKSIEHRDKMKVQIQKILDDAKIADDQIKLITPQIVSLVDEMVNSIVESSVQLANQNVINQKLSRIVSKINCMKKEVKYMPYSKSRSNSKLKGNPKCSNKTNSKAYSNKTTSQSADATSQSADATSQSADEIGHQKNESNAFECPIISPVESQKENRPKIIKRKEIRDQNGYRCIGINFRLKTFDKDGSLKSVESYNRNEDPFYIRIKRQNQKKKNQSSAILSQTIK